MLSLVLLVLCGQGSARGGPPSPLKVGRWAPVVNWPLVAVHVSVLPNGKLLVWDRDQHMTVWDPQKNAFTPVPLPGKNLFCSGHAFLPSGDLLVTGGNITDGVGLNTTYLFRYGSQSWIQAENMNAGRWYPANCGTADGGILVVSGNIDNVVGTDTIPQIWHPGSGYRTLTGAALDLPLYPFLHLAPNGMVFNSGPNYTSRYLDPTGAGSWIAVDAHADFRDYGSSVMYEPGKVLVAGGGDPPLQTAEVIDLNQPSPRWRVVAPMGHARRQLNATLLPDGKVLITGGTAGGGFNNACGSVTVAEMWDPVTEKFTDMASAAEARLYHSTAALLPDGRVFNGGGGQPASTDCPDADHLTMQFYSPPYLFKGPRPFIESAPAQVAPGRTFFVATTDGPSINAVTWVRLSSVTHSQNQNQRWNRLSFETRAGGLSVTAPADHNLCPPGHYMLFILNGSGVPSVSQIIQLL